MSLMFELLTSVLVANPIVAPFHQKAPGAKKHRQNAALIALDVSAFGDVSAFKSMVDAAADGIKGLTPAQEGSEVLLPGERSARAFKQRGTEGIPVPPKTWEALVEAAKAVGVEIGE
jgi:LDH2 family malate/lactate/ureidoglycolate dehydrogenase